MLLIIKGDKAMYMHWLGSGKQAIAIESKIHLPDHARALIGLVVA